MNAFDKALSFVAPGLAQKNLESRIKLHQFENHAIKPNKLRGHSGGMHKNAGPETHRANRDRISLMWDARDMEDNNSIVAGILERTCQYAVGKLEYKSNTGDPAIDTAYEDYFHSWSKHADVTGRATLRELIEYGLRGMLRDGDYGWCILNDGNNIKLQAVEADRIGSPQESVQNEKYFGGIVVNDLGQPEIYRVFKRSRTNQYRIDKEVDSNHFIHLYRFNRSDQYRGTSWLKTVLPHARDLHEIFGYEKQGAKFSSMWSAFIKKKEIRNNSTGADWEANATNQHGKDSGYFQAEPGKIGKMNLDEDIEFAPGVQRPSGAFVNLVEAVLHHISMGLNLPYGFIYKMSSFGGVTARLETSQAQRTFERWQRLLVDKVLDRVRDQVLALGIAQGKIPAHPNFRKGSWRFGAHITADIQHQTNADIQLIKEGLKTRSEWCAEHDKDFTDVQKGLAQEMVIMRDTAANAEIPIELMHEGKPQATDLLAAMNDRNNPPPPPPPLIEKGVDLKPLLDILEQVGEKGSMDRETAINNIMEIYGLEYQQAESMVPIKTPAPALDINSPIKTNPISVAA